MQQVQLQLTDQLYRQASQRAVEAGFASLDEYLVDAVSELVSEPKIEETENLDHQFTPKVVAHLHQIQDEIKAGAKTYTEEEMKEHFQERSRAWREAHAS